jgi:hypothetical protein
MLLVAVVVRTTIRQGLVDLQLAEMAAQMLLDLTRLQQTVAAVGAAVENLLMLEEMAAPVL